MSRQWIPQREGGAWGSGPELELDPAGYVTSFTPNVYAETPVCKIKGGHYPSGDYTLFFQGEG